MKVEVNRTLSGQRIFRAGLPQGSVLSTSLCCERYLKKVPRCFPYMYIQGSSGVGKEAGRNYSPELRPRSV